MKMALTRSLAIAFVSAIVVQAGAQDEGRVNEILMHAENRASNEADAAFAYGEYPKVIQNQKVRLGLRPWDGELSTDLVWMLGNVENRGGALLVAMRFRELNPGSPDSGYAEAQLYNEWKLYSRVPSALEPDILKVPPPHRNSFTMLSAAYMRMGFYADVVRVLEIALRHYPEEAVFKLNRDRAAARISR